MLCLKGIYAHASHTTGGDMTYTFIKDTTISGNLFQVYTVTLLLYQDCKDGVSDAIQQDNPAFFTVYENGGSLLRVDTNIYYDPTPGSGGATTIPQEEVTTGCGIVPLQGNRPCLLRKKFSKRYYLPQNTAGYVVVYQRCCRTASVENLVDAGEKGVTFFCTIPGAGGGMRNSSAVFKDHPTPVICMNEKMILDVSATDADGDSLTYEFSNIYEGASGPDIKPKVTTAPPFDTVQYQPAYWHAAPVFVAEPIQIDPIAGIVTVVPGKIGRYQVGICCNEWRNGVLINKVYREFQWTVINCNGLIESYKPNAGVNRTVLQGDTIHFHAKGAIRYSWNPATFLSDAGSPDPIGTFTELGDHTYILYGETNNDCKGYDTITIFVREHSGYTAPNAFTPNGDGINDRLIPMPVGKSRLRSFSIYNRWGKRVYYTTELMAGIGWDGKEQDIGVYLWQIEYTDNLGEERTERGNTTLLR
ncbi:hypothetical protein GCM10023093_16620 [Nemorincola caseinilytica]|uniref:Gliding motility-associated C-terminal domain-containing protein n=2 Tax=Nemorincola caseinilytica TaxID=2054315 RepID=A0ABP8NGI6_9BACT